VDVFWPRNVTLEVQWESEREKGDGGREVCGGALMKRDRERGVEVVNKNGGCR